MIVSRRRPTSGIRADVGRSSLHTRNKDFRYFSQVISMTAASFAHFPWCMSAIERKPIVVHDVSSPPHHNQILSGGYFFRQEVVVR